jgi:hypothetical protein
VRWPRSVDLQPAVTSHHSNEKLVVITGNWFGLQLVRVFIDRPTTWTKRLETSHNKEEETLGFVKQCLTPGYRCGFTVAVSQFSSSWIWLTTKARKGHTRTPCAFPDHTSQDVIVGGAVAVSVGAALYGGFRKEPVTCDLCLGTGA